MAGTIHVDEAAPDPDPDPDDGAAVTVTTPGSTFSPERVEILPGDTVLWQFSGSGRVRVR